MSEGVLGFDNNIPFCCLSIERQKTVINVVFKVVDSGKGRWGHGGIYGVAQGGENDLHR